MPPDLSPAAAEVHAVAERLRQAVNHSDADGIVACWAPDGIMMPPSHAAVHGAAAIGDYFRNAFAARRLTFTFTAFSVELHGDVAIERLDYGVVVAATTGETTQDVGKGLHVYRRRADGPWQLTLDIWNSSGPASAAAGS